MDNTEYQQESMDLNGSTDIADTTNTMLEKWEAVFGGTDMPTAVE